MIVVNNVVIAEPMKHHRARTAAMASPAAGSRNAAPPQ